MKQKILMIHAMTSGCLLLLTTRTTTTTFAFQHPVHAIRHARFATPRFQLYSSSSAATSTKRDNFALPDFANKEEYENYIKADEQSALPRGFACGTAKGTFVPQEAPMMGPLPIRATVIALDEATDSWTACFTKNKFPGAPIQVGKQRLSNNHPLQALVINNKVSNVCSGSSNDGGVTDAETVCQAVASGLNLPHGPASVLPSSTGVIGWRLPAKELAEDVVPKAIEAMQKISVAPAAEAIMTTDRFPKVRSCTLECGARIVGIAKGAGMIEPNMATMLSYILTDAEIDRSTLTSLLQPIVDKTYNSISVDGDESTSDTVAAVSSNLVPLSSNDEDDEDSNIEEFRQALESICQGLASDIVRNGEGTSHVMRVQVENFPGSNADARKLGRHVVNGPLFKCAVSGNDPNTGRLAGAVGSFMGKYFDLHMDGDGANLDQEAIMKGLNLTLGGRVIFSKGQFRLEGDDVERELSLHMKDAEYDAECEYPPHQKYVEIGIVFNGEGAGEGMATVLGSDLTAEYVAVNADYRS